MLSPNEAGVLVHPNAIVESPKVGSGTRIWAFAHVLPGASIGRDCNICDGVFVENDVIVGDRVTLKCGVQLWDGLRLEDDVFVGPNATFTNDPMPRSGCRPGSFAVTLVKRGASIGANATILPGVVIGAGAMVGAGAVVTRSVPPHAVVVGNPARIVRYTESQGGAGGGGADPVRAAAGRRESPRVNGVQLSEVSLIRDMRGNLLAREVGKGLPFVPKRMFVVRDVPSTKVRGEHAHRICDQFLIALAGSVTVVVDDGMDRCEVVLDDPGVGLFLPRMVWGTQYKYSADAVLLVLASELYDADDYIRSYDDYISLRRGASGKGEEVE